MLGPRVRLQATYSKTVGTSAVELIPESQGRRYLHIQNVSAGTVGISLAPDVPVIGMAGTITLPAGASMSWEDQVIPTNSINAIGSGAGLAVTVWEQ